MFADSLRFKNGFWNTLLCITVLQFLFMSLGFGQNAHFIKDLSPGSDETNYPEHFVVRDGVLFFSADDDLHDRELWAFDGTQTWLVKDLSFGYSDIGYMGHTDRFIYYGYQANPFNRLVVSDGTAEGTYSMRDAFSNATWQSYPYPIESIGDQLLFFSYYDGYFELWGTNGTNDGTSLIRRIGDGTNNSIQETVSTVWNNKVLFLANAGYSNWQLWISDGTPQGTNFILDLSSITYSLSRMHIVPYGDKALVFVNGTNEVHFWSTSGSPQTTTKITLNTLKEFLTPFVSMDFGVFFVGRDDNTSDYELWKTDGTSTGTHQVKDIRPGTTGSYPYRLTQIENTIVFFANDGVHGNELWASDGTESGTQLLEDIEPGPDGITTSALTFWRDKLFFFPFDDQIWKTDGTPSGTSLAWNTVPGFSRSTVPVVYDDKLTFTDRSKVLFFDEVALTSLSDQAPMQGNSTTFESFTPFLGKTLFTARNGTSINDLWETSGQGWNTQTIDEGASSSNLVAVEDQLFFTKYDMGTGRELWVSDATLTDFHLVNDLLPGPGSYPISDQKPYKDKLLFTQNISNSWPTGLKALWVTDGTEGQTTRLGEFYDFSRMFVLEDYVYFTAKSTSNTFGKELYRTDGTPEGTTLFIDLNPDGDSFDDYELLGVSNGFLYFQPELPLYGRELWRTDGTLEETKLVKDIVPGVESSSIYYFAPSNQKTFFLQGNELWVTEGNEADTAPVSTVKDDQGRFDYLGITEKGLLFFAIRNYHSNVKELWRSEGTNATTFKLIDLPFESSDWYVFRDRLFFSAPDPNTGQELWISDGTVLGTHLIEDLSPGPFSSSPKFLGSDEATLYFSAHTFEHGRELWSLCLEPSSTILAMSSACTGMGINQAYVPFAGAGTTYEWMIDGGTIVTGHGTPYMTYTADGTGPVDLTVQVTTAGNCTSTSSLSLPVISVMPDPVVEIYGPDAFCVGEKNVGFHVTPSPTADGYEWQVPNGAKILSGQGTSSIFVTFGSEDGLISATAINACGASSPFEKHLEIATPPLQAYAGEDQALCGIQTVLDANPPHVGGMGNWTILSGEGGSIVDPNRHDSEFLGIPNELFHLRWTLVGDPCQDSYDDVVIWFYADPIIADAGDDIDFCGSHVTLDAEMPAYGVGHWELVDPDLPGNILHPDQHNSEFYGSYGTPYQLRWVIENGPCNTVFDELTVILYEAPSEASAGSNRMYSINEVAQLDGVIEPYWKGTWHVETGPSTSLDQFSNIHDPQATFTPFGGIGLYELVLSVVSGPCNPYQKSVLLSFDEENRTPRKLVDNSGLTVNQMAQMISSQDDVLFYRTGYDQPAVGSELWKTNGTQSGTLLIKDLIEGPDSSFIGSSFTLLGNHFFYESREDNLWKTDGSEAGTELIWSGKMYSNGLVHNGVYYFSGGDVEMREAELYRTDGTQEGTFRVKDIYPDTSPGSALNSYPSDFTVFQNTLYFIAQTSHGDDLIFKSDGTEQGTEPIWDLANITDFQLCANQQKLFFVDNHSSLGNELWVSDGTSSGTMLLLDYAQGDESAYYRSLMIHNNQLFFLVHRASDDNRWYLWKSDGTPGGTHELDASIRIENHGNIYSVGDHFLFNGFFNGPHGLWISDGTAAGSHSILSPLDIQFFEEYELEAFVPINESVFYFLGGPSSATRKNVFISDGTESGTEPLREQIEQFMDISGLFAHNSQLYLQGDLPSSESFVMQTDAHFPSAQIIAPDIVCPGVDNYQAYLKNVPANSTIHWTLTHGDLMDGQGTNQITFHARNEEFVRFSVAISPPNQDGSPVFHHSTPVFGFNFSDWSSGASPFDRNHDGQTNVLDFSRLTDDCSNQ